MAMRSASPHRRAARRCAARSGGDRHVNDTAPQRQDQSIWDRLRRRKVVQWSVAYVAAAWALLQGLEFLSDIYDWPTRFFASSLSHLLWAFRSCDAWRGITATAESSVSAAPS